MKTLLFVSWASRLVVVLWMLFGLCTPASAGHWEVDHYNYIYNGNAHSENIDGGILRKGGIIERDGDIWDEKGNGGSQSQRGFSLRAGVGRGPATTGFFPAKPADTANGSIDTTVTAVLRWKPRMINNQRDIDVTDKPKRLYVRETVSAYGEKALMGNNGNAINEMYNAENPWRGEYYKITASLGSYNNGSIYTGISGASVSYGPFTKTKIHCIENPGNEVKVPSYHFKGTVKMEPGHEKLEHADWISGASLRFGYYVEPLNVRFSLSTSPSGTSPGARSPDSFWDGFTTTTDPEEIDPITGELRQYPVVTRFSPDQRNYYLVIQGTVKLPDEIEPPSSVELKAERVWRNKAGEDEVIDSDSISLKLASESRSGQPVPDGLGNTTYTYRTHDLDPDEKGPRWIAGSDDWKIDKKLGRWRFEVEKWDSDKVQFRIDKRAQVVGYALEWVNYYEYKRANAVDETERNKWGGNEDPGGLWDLCFSFAGHIYGQLGLDISDGSGSGMFGAATAPDDGPGSLSFFWSQVARNNGWANDPSHVAIVGPVVGNIFASNGTRIDNNGSPADANGFFGPTWRRSDDGVGSAYVTGPAGFQPQSRTLPSKRGKINPATGKPESLLQELDEE